MFEEVRGEYEAVELQNQLRRSITHVVGYIQSFAYQFWKKCDNIQKYKDMLFNKDDEVCVSTYTLKRPEWNLLALTLLLNDNSYDRIMYEYKNELLKNKSIFEGLEERISQFKEMEKRNGKGFEFLEK